MIDAPRSNKCGGHAGNLAAFLRVHRVLRSRGIGSRRIACFHFDESERIAVVSDEIDFAVQMSQSKVARNHRVSMPAEIPVGVGFATNASPAGAFLPGFPRKAVDEAASSAKLENGENEPGEDGRSSRGLRSRVQTIARRASRGKRMESCLHRHGKPGMSA